MSQEVAIVAIAQPAPGKLEQVCRDQRLRTSRDMLTVTEQFKQVTKEAIDWIRENEPETLQFDMSEAETEEGVKITLIER